MTGRPPPKEERDLDRWVQEATEGWRMPPLTQDRDPLAGTDRQ